MGITVSRRGFFGLLATIPLALRWKCVRPFPDPAVNLSVPMHWPKPKGIAVRFVQNYDVRADLFVNRLDVRAPEA